MAHPRDSCFKFSECQFIYVFAISQNLIMNKKDRGWRPLLSWWISGTMYIRLSVVVVCCYCQYRVHVISFSLSQEISWHRTWFIVGLSSLFVLSNFIMSSTLPLYLQARDKVIQQQFLSTCLQQIVTEVLLYGETFTRCQELNFQIKTPFIFSFLSGIPPDHQ